MDADVAAAYTRLLEAAQATAAGAAPAATMGEDLERLYTAWTSATALAHRLLLLEASLLQDVTAQRDFLATRVAELERALEAIYLRPGQTPA